jgi:diguanylate cyclase (GGDEF)-like protein
MSVFSAERYYDRHIDTEGNLYLGWISDDEFDSETAAKFMDIMNGDGISYFEEKTEWGTDYTGAVPIKDKSGKGIAVLAVDIDISFLQGIIREYALTNTVVIIMAGFVFIGLFLMWLNRNITRPIGQLENSAVGFAGHSHGQRDIEALSFEAPDIKRDNEIKSLSDAVVQMTENMKDYVTDILNAEQEADKQKKRATRDALTGVRNKAAYEDEIRELEEKIKDGESKYGIAVVDLNYLKTINDSYGHDKGDLAIKNLCEMICAIFKHSSVFRIGGDEFAVILQGADYDNYESLIEHFYREAELLEDNESLKPWEKVVAAVGAAFYDSASDDSIDDVFRRADQEMYICKKAMKAERAEG